MTAASHARTLQPFLELVARQFSGNGVPTFWLANAEPIAWEVGGAWIGPGAHVDGEGARAAALLSLFAGAAPPLGLRHLRRLPRTDLVRAVLAGERVLRNARLDWGRTDADGGVLLARTGAVSRSRLHTEERTLEPAGMPVVCLVVDSGDEGRWATFVAPVDGDRVERLAEEGGPAEEDSAIPETWRASRRALRRARIVLAGRDGTEASSTWPPRADVWSTGAAVLDSLDAEERIGVEKDARRALGAICWRPALACGLGSLGALVLARAGTPGAAALAGEVARLALGVIASRSGSIYRDRSSRLRDAWRWEAEPSPERHAGLVAMARAAGWDGPDTLAPQATSAGLEVPRPEDGTERRRAAWLRHALWLLPRDRPFWVTEREDWIVRRALLDELGLPEHRAAPLIGFCRDGTERAAVQRVARAVDRDAEAFDVRDLPVDPVALHGLRGVGEGSVAVVREMLERLLEEAARPVARIEDGAEAASRLEDGLASLSALFDSSDA
ncbi:MAG: hypothetical protein EA398_02080 [Deltaproteobacteria bacterium]|nr:MAG: hypothetical protein EA398_02080 [Deltaproteobacteria bacterium]